MIRSSDHASDFARSALFATRSDSCTSLASFPAQLFSETLLRSESDGVWTDFSSNASQCEVERPDGDADLLEVRTGETEVDRGLDDERPEEAGEGVFFLSPCNVSG